MVSSTRDDLDLTVIGIKADNFSFSTSVHCVLGSPYRT